MAKKLAIPCAGTRQSSSSRRSSRRNMAIGPRESWRRHSGFPASALFSIWTTPSGAASSATTGSKASASARATRWERRSSPSSITSRHSASAALCSPFAARTIQPSPNGCFPSTPRWRCGEATSHASSRTGRTRRRTCDASQANSTSVSTPGLRRRQPGRASTSSAASCRMSRCPSCRRIVAIYAGDSPTAGYFEAAAFTADDLTRAQSYQANAERQAMPRTVDRHGGLSQDPAP